MAVTRQASLPLKTISQRWAPRPGMVPRYNDCRLADDVGRLDMSTRWMDMGGGLEFTRRQALGSMALGAAVCMIGEEAMGNTAAASALPRCAPGDVGMDEAGILAFLDAVEEKVGGLHGLMLLRHGKVAAEGWWKPYGPRYPHMLFSLSKSFTSTAVGLAVAEGRLSVEDRVVSLFPDEAPAGPSANLAAMRVRHLLTMSTGHATDTTGPTTSAKDGNWVKAFLALPVEHEPGAPFVYNSTATYMLSAIVQKLTGKRLVEYLKPRLFDPLGIRGMTWQTCPRGIDAGGWGLSIKTEDIARFGQLYLQRGVWNGRQVVPAHWIAAATSKQVSNGSDLNNDWNQGYGYQFWRCRHNVYRGDGAFGQYCVVMPEQDAVVAITSGVGDMGAVMNCVWDHLLPAMDRPGVASGRLKDRLASLEVAPPRGRPVTPEAKALNGRTYRIEPNDLKVASATFGVSTGRIVLTLQTDKDRHLVTCGMTGWVRGALALEGTPPRRIATRGAWADNRTLVMKACYYETPFVRTVTVRFAGDDVTISWKDNVGFGPTEGPTLKGKVA